MLALAALVLAAWAVRWPYLWLIPRFTDETLEVLHSLAIARGEHWPLTNYDSYYGALFNYLLAGAFSLIGPDPLLPRALVWLLGGLTVVPVYLLGAELRGRTAGLIAAALLATSGAHVVVNSHIAWSNCVTPLFTTTALWLIQRALNRSSGPALAGAALCFGLALQTHPAVAALLPGVGAVLLWKGRSLLQPRWLGLAGALFLLGYGNMVIYNLATGFESLRSAQRISAEYAQAEDPGGASALAMLVLLARALGSAIDQRSGPVAYLLDPLVLASVGLAGLALVWEARRGQPLLALVTLSFLVLLPLFNAKFRTLVTVRYLMPLVPLAYAAIGALLAGWLAGSPPGRARLRTIGSAVLVGLLAAGPMLPLQRYYDRLLAAGDTNERIFRLTQAIQEHRQPHEQVLVDETLGGEQPGTGVTELRGFRYLLTVAEVPHQAIRVTPRRLEDELEMAPSRLAVLNARDAEQAERRLQLTSVEGIPRASIGRAADFQVYRIER